MVQRHTLDRLAAKGTDPLAWYEVDRATLEVEQCIDGNLTPGEELLDDGVRDKRQHRVQVRAADLMRILAAAALPGLEEESVGERIP